ncbi:MAG: DUF2436 domain-containing protein [Bacteroidales bacterium]|nr:DUF2436 domain-containing protein [Bacteroidales bacterium]
MKKIFTLVMAIFAVVAMNAQNAKIVLEAYDVWGDGTGYQLLIDADNAGWDDTRGPDCGSTYSGWEYVIPAGATMAADGEPYCVVDGAEMIMIPAGTYSYLILNPGCNDYAANYIAAGTTCDETNTSYTFEANKTYTFTLTLSASGNDCTTLTVTDGIVGVEEVAAEQARIYPNPATDVLNVEGNGNIEISNILGQVVMTDFVEGHTQLNVANLNNGVYFVRVNGQSMKFVKR